MGSVAKRASGLATVRCDIYERIGPYKRSGNLQRFSSPYLRKAHRAMVRDFRIDLERWLPEVGAATPRVANAIEAMMVGVVESGTATSLARGSLTVGAKTGTAEVNTVSGAEDTHAWVIGFAGPREGEPEIAFAVIVEAVPGQGHQKLSGPILWQR